MPLDDEIKKHIDEACRPCQRPNNESRIDHCYNDMRLADAV